MPAQKIPLRALRKARGLSLDDIWLKTGLDRGHLSRLERGLVKPSGRTKKILEKFYGLPASLLFPESEAQ